MAQSLDKVRRGFERLLEAIVILLMVVLALEVTVGTVFREIGSALAWYDEVASVLLAWLTYYGSALAAMKRAHISVPGVVRAMPRPLRLPVTLLAEALVFAFFGLLGWVGWSILGVLAGDTLVSLPQVSVEYTQSVIPIGSALFIIAEALNLPRILSEARGAGPQGEVDVPLEVTH